MPARLAVRTRGAGPMLVLLHAGVADARAWEHQLDTFSPHVRVVAYDRRGFGDTEYDPDEPFSHVDDLLDILGDERAILVGNSQGGRIAIDLALAHPDRVRALVLVASAVSGTPDEIEHGLPCGELEIDRAIAEADEAGDLDRVNALEARLWLDGPSSAEGRVSGALRELFLDMNGRALRAAPPTAQNDAPAAWDRLGEITAPTLVVDGALDLDYVHRVSTHIAASIPGAQRVVIDGAAHLPQLEAPQRFAAAVMAFLTDAGLV